VLTCKSLFGLGYRGERLIEPFSTRWLRVVAKTTASGRSNRVVYIYGSSVVGSRDCQIAGTSCLRLLVPSTTGNSGIIDTSGKLEGMVKIQQIGIIGSQALRVRKRLWVQFTD